MDKDEHRKNLITQINRISFLEHTLRNCFNILLFTGLLKLIFGLSSHQFVNILYFCIGWDILFHFLAKPIGIYYLKSALSYILIASVFIGITLYLG